LEAKIMSRNALAFAILLLAFGSVRGEPIETDANLGQGQNRAIPRFDRLSGAGWGHAVDGLRAKVLRPSGRKKIGEAVPIVLIIRNDGTSGSPQGTAVLGPRLFLRVSRNEWVKSLIVPVHQLNPEEAYYSLEKGEEFTYAANLARLVDLSVPGEYLVIGGYDSSAATRFPSAWKGGRVTSPPYGTITLIKGDAAPARRKRPRKRHQMQETEWGQQVRGLRVKLAVQTGSHSVGEPIPATVTIENLGTPDHADGAAQLFPHLDVLVRRVGWEKRVRVRLNIENRVRIKKNESFTHSLDLSKTVDLDVPGEYTVSAGHSNHDLTDIGDWMGNVYSPFQAGVIVVESEKEAEACYRGGPLRGWAGSAPVEGISGGLSNSQILSASVQLAVGSSNQPHIAWSSYVPNGRPHVYCVFLPNKRANTAEARNPSNHPPMQTSLWGARQHGLQCRVKTPVQIEQGMPLEATVELRCDPKGLDAGIKRLNVFLPAAFLSLSLSNEKTGKVHTVRPYDPTSGMPVDDSGKAACPLDGSPLKPWQVRFPLVSLYRDIQPGDYECQVTYSFPEKRTDWWRADETKWSNAGFWYGTITSGKFRIDVLKETPKTRTYLLPKRLRLEKKLKVVRRDPAADDQSNGERSRVRTEKDPPIVPVPIVWFAKDDAQEVTVPVRNGHFVATYIYRNRREGPDSLQGSTPRPDHKIHAWHDYEGGDKTVAFEFEVFETADVPEHLWLPGPGSGGYRVLWKKTFTISFTEESFREQPVVALDLSGSNITDARLAIVEEMPLLKRLSLGRNEITDEGLKHLQGLKHLESLYLHNNKLTDAGLVRLKGLKNLKTLYLSGSQVTDAGLRHLEGLTNLENLALARTAVADAGLAKLRGFTQLKHLTLYETNVSDAGLIHLRGLRNLQWLSLTGTQVTDAGLQHLKGLTSLKTLRLGRTRVTDGGVSNLRQMLPTCTIER